MEAAAVGTLLFVIAPVPGLGRFVATALQEPIEEVVVWCGCHTWHGMPYHYINLYPGEKLAAATATIRVSGPNARQGERRPNRNPYLVSA